LVVGDHQSGEMFDLSVAASNDMVRHVDQFTTIELKYKSLASSSSGQAYLGTKGSRSLQPGQVGTALSSLLSIP
jgi:hypothetical protein